VGVAALGGETRWLAYGDGVRVPWSIAATPDGTVLVSELIGQTVEALNGQAAASLWTGGLVYELTYGSGKVAFSDGETAYVLDLLSGGLTQTRTMALSPTYRLWILLTWACGIFLFCVVFWLAVQTFKLIRGMPFSEARRRMLIASASVLLTVILVMAFLFSFVQKQMQSQIVNTLSQLAESISANSGDTLGAPFAAIRSLDDYRGEAYNDARDYMDAFCNASYHNHSNLYYVLYRFDQTMLWGVMDYENTTGVRYPYTPIEGTVYQSVIETGKSLHVEGEANIYGMWSYAVAPIYAETGDMIGLVEIGTNQYGEVMAQRTLIRDVLTGVLVALLMAMLAFNELTAFHDHRVKKRLLRLAGDGRLALGFIRPLIFLVFMADNMDAAYIPQLSASLGAASASWIGDGLASALPMSLQLFVIGISALLAGRLLDRRTPRAVLAGGFGLQTVGALLSVSAILTSQYWLLLLAKAVGGLGTGAAVVTCNAMPGRTGDPVEQQTLIAGLNIGVITGVVLGSSVGGYIADYLGYTAAYFASVACVFMAALLGWHSLRGVRHVTVEEEENEGASRGSARRFLGDRRVLGFLICVMLPYMLMMYFKDYLFPLFASGLGKTESVIGSVMLLGGVLAIFLGDVVPDALLKKLDAWNALRLSNLVCMYALVLFALKPVFETAVVTVCLLGVSASFGYASQGVYYTEMIRRNNISDGKAMGLYSLFDNLGQTSGPLGLSALLFMGVALECGAIAAGAAVLLGVGTLVTGKRKRRNGM
ncbi:MAG TPA: MFS transporter, partial [Candidatus Limiplasma sp.]|nr:MFS transporter [Candidatus Limiplasma sp.]